MVEEGFGGGGGVWDWEMTEELWAAAGGYPLAVLRRKRRLMEKEGRATV